MSDTTTAPAVPQVPDVTAATPWVYADELSRFPQPGTPMTLAQFRTVFSAWLHRGDASPQQLNTFINQGIMEINRVLKVPEMEQIATWNSPDGIPITVASMPARVREFYDVYLDGQTANPTTLRNMLRGWGSRNGPSFCRNGGSLIFSHPCRAVTVVYRQDFAPVNDDTDTSPLFTFAFDLILYASLSYAGDFFRMEKLADWSNSFTAFLSALNNSADDLAYEGGPMQMGPVGGTELTETPSTTNLYPAWWLGGGGGINKV